MPLEVPTLQNRDYADILRDALARIPVHNPAWTNFNDSDPGVTMLQLFAFMTESILYRANQIPERNRLKFLKLLGIPLRPATAANGFVTLSNERGPLESRAFPPGLDVRAGQVRFRTTHGLDVLPIEARLFYKRALPPASTDDDIERAQLYTQLYADLLEDNQSAPAFYETAPMPQPAADGALPVLDLADTVDGCLWLALLARPGDNPADVVTVLAGKTLTVGAMPRLEDEGVMVEAGQTSRAASRSPLRWEIASPLSTDNAAHYKLLNARSEGSILTAPGLVELTLPGKDELITWNWAKLEPGLEGTGEYPPSLADTNFGQRVITWLRLRVDKSAGDASVKARLSWVGINATMVQQRVHIDGELVGLGNGEPDQCFRLANTPVLPESLRLTVGGRLWHQLDDLLAADPEVPVTNPRQPIYQSEAAISAQAELRNLVYTLDPESGDICTGDGAHGIRPKAGQPVVASYAFGGGRQGNVGLGLLNRSPQLPAGYKVSNPLRTWGGDDAQSPASAEKSIPRTIQHRDRLVSVDDFRDVTRQTPGVDLGRVEVLPLFNPTDPDAAPLPGAVTLVMVPASAGFDTPQPDQFFLEAVCDHLQPRRLVTTELYVRGPQYEDIWLSIGIEILNGHASGPVRDAVKQEMFRFLSPLYGGRKDSGWPLNVPVLAQELEAMVARVEGVRLVQRLLLGTASTDDLTVVPIANLQLPRLRDVAVTEGEPLPLNQLRNAPPVATPPPGQRWTPIPVLPEQC